MFVQEDPNLVIDEGYVKRSGMLVSFWFLLAVLALVLGFFGILRPDSQTVPMWFQRSGSVATVLLILAERRLSILIDKLNPRGIGDLAVIELWNKYSSDLIFYRDRITVFIMLSTIIWGFGDLWR